MNLNNKDLIALQEFSGHCSDYEGVAKSFGSFSMFKIYSYLSSYMSHACY